MKTRVIVPYHNGAPFIDQCLRSLEESSLSIEEVIIVDNSPERLQADSLSYPSQLTLLRTQASIGFGRACNVGIEHALSKDTDFLVLLNQDARVFCDTLLRLTEALSESDRIFAAFPLSFDFEMKSLTLKYIAYYVTRYHEFIRDLIMGNPKRSYDIGPTESNGSCVVLRADILREIPHFDPLYWMYGEERDMFRRAAANGSRLILVPAAKIGHRHTNFSDSESNPTYFETLHRYSVQIDLIKNPERYPLVALLTLLTFSISSCVRGYLSFGVPMVKCALQSDLKLARKLRLAFRHRTPELLLQTIQSQLSLDKRVDSATPNQLNSFK